jgi:aminoglycoside 2''-phosphotransferase
LEKPEIEYYLALISQHFPGLITIDDSRVTVITEGWSSLVLDIDDRLIFRFPRRPEVIAGYRKEITLLPELARVLPVPVPVFDFISIDSPDYRDCFVGYNKIYGDPWSYETSESPAITRQVASFLTQLHQFPIEKAVHIPGLQNSQAQWREKYVELYDWFRLNAFQLLEMKNGDRLTMSWNSYLSDSRNFSFQPSLIHGDLCVDHILCDYQKSSISGIIDWEDATLGDPALDFVGILYAAGWEALEPIFNTYQGLIGDNFHQRINFFLGAIPLHQIRFGLETDDNHIVQEGLEVLARFTHNQ